MGMFTLEQQQMVDAAIADKEKRVKRELTSRRQADANRNLPREPNPHRIGERIVGVPMPDGALRDQGKV